MEGKEGNIRITNIQRMCFHDGPGIRTTVFLKGCCLHCPWCSNPENVSYEIQEYDDNGNKGKYGRDVSTEELFTELMKDKGFWGSDGGVTFSGGEALLQSRELIPLLKRLHEEGVNVAVESSLFIPGDNFTDALEYIDYLIADVKVLDNAKCHDILGGNIDIYRKNVDYSYNKGKLMLFRIPLCYEYTFGEEDKNKLIEFIGKYIDVPVEIFAIHNLGEKKYLSLGKTPWTGEMVREEDIVSFQKQLITLGADCKIIKI